MWTALLIALPLFLGGTFEQKVLNAPIAEMQQPPGTIARWADRLWHRIARAELARYQEREEKLLPLLQSLQKSLPPTEATVIDPDAWKAAMRGTYGKLPEVYADAPVPFIFPKPFSAPIRASWYQVAREAAQALTVQEEVSGWAAQATAAQATRQWLEARRLFEKATSELRHLETWIPSLERTSGALPQGAWSGWSPALFSTLRESLRPERIIRRPFLPRELRSGMTVELPIVTDIQNDKSGRKFRREIADALEIHWNRSPWARGENIRIHVRWNTIPEDRNFADGLKTFEEHLTLFPPDLLGMTTGGTSNYVHGHIMILSPSEITVRGLAHELGHLLGFGDCYLRTLTAQGPAGIFGLAVLEWDNPVFPDDLMCDDRQGVARAEKW